MNDSNRAVVPRRMRNEVSPPAPLDSYVTDVVKWIASQELGVPTNALVKLMAQSFDWPMPFAEAILAATRGRRLLSQSLHGTSLSQRSILSKRGHAWLDHAREFEKASRSA
jgi:hypothetical protein